MKKMLIVLAALALATVQAQAATNTKAKVDPKNNKVSHPVVEKVKLKENVMTRDQLRTCMDLQDANAAEGEAVEGEIKAYKANSEKLRAEHERLDAATKDINERTLAAKAEFDAIMKANEEFKVAAPKMEKADFEAKKKVLVDRSAAFTTMRDKIIADSKALGVQTAALNAGIDNNNTNFKTLNDRREAQLEKVDDWKFQCSHKKYDENDEIAIKKERAAKAVAAAAAASAASAAASDAASDAAPAASVAASAAASAAASVLTK